MGRIGKKFEELRANKEKALIVYLTAGDPSLAATRELVLSLEKSGVN
ncbi:MAG: tryptophan synthase subunit alpha, partial [Syntrophaceae bacterium]|nr:tryptophan synthase subunit alpha [Syntrophaceae bacterium]